MRLFRWKLVVSTFYCKETLHYSVQFWEIPSEQIVPRTTELKSIYYEGVLNSLTNLCQLDTSEHKPVWRPDPVGKTLILFKWRILNAELNDSNWTINYEKKLCKNMLWIVTKWLTMVVCWFMYYLGSLISWYDSKIF